MDDPHNTNLPEPVTSLSSSMKFVTCSMQFHYCFLQSCVVWHAPVGRELTFMYYCTEEIQHAW